MEADASPGFNDIADIDSEFGLVQLDDDKLPTLESILHEKETDVYNFEDLHVLPRTDENASDDGTCSIMSEALPPSYVSISDILKPRRPSVHGSVLRHVILRKVGQSLPQFLRKK